MRALVHPTGSEMATSKIQRWLDLLAVLVGRRIPVGTEEIMEKVPGYRERLGEDDSRARESVRRMFERDKDELRAIGIPLETRTFREGLEEVEGYRILRGDFYLPYLQLLSSEEEVEAVPPSPASSYETKRVPLTEEDARTAVLALRGVLSLPSFPFRSEARGALRKLTFDLDPALGPETLEPRVRILDRPGGADPREVLGVFLEALHERRLVRFRYHSMGRDSVEEREVEPWGLLFQHGGWYLAARDRNRSEEAGDVAVRLFRVDRVVGEASAGSGTAGPDFQVPEDFDIRAYAQREAWELEGNEEGGDLEVVVRFLPPLSLLALRNGWGEPVEPEADDADDETVLRSFRVRRLDPFLRWVLSLAGEARIERPDTARTGLERMARWVHHAHQEDE